MTTNNASVQRAIKIYARIKPSLNRQTAVITFMLHFLHYFSVFLSKKKAFCILVVLPVLGAIFEFYFWTFFDLQNYDLISSETSEEEFLTIAIKQNPEDGYINNKPEHHSFRFSKIFDRPTSQEQVFADVAKPVVDRWVLLREKSCKK